MDESQQLYLRLRNRNEDGPTLSRESEHELIDLLADLLLAVAATSDTSKDRDKGDIDEQQDR
jgi:hypothetical protein